MIVGKRIVVIGELVANTLCTNAEIHNHLKTEKEVLNHHHVLEIIYSTNIKLL